MCRLAAVSLGFFLILEMSWHLHILIICPYLYYIFTPSERRNEHVTLKKNSISSFPPRGLYTRTSSRLSGTPRHALEIFLGYPFSTPKFVSRQYESPLKTYVLLLRPTDTVAMASMELSEQRMGSCSVSSSSPPSSPPCAPPSGAGGADVDVVEVTGAPYNLWRWRQSRLHYTLRASQSWDFKTERGSISHYGLYRNWGWKQKET